MEGHGDRGSSPLPSRLSAFAQPFNPQPSLISAANSCQQPCRPSQDGSQSSDSSFSLVGSFPDLNLEGNSVLDDAYNYCGHQSEMGITDFPYDNSSGFSFDFDGQSIYSSWHPSALQENSMPAVPYDSDFDAMPLTESSMPSYTQNLSGFDYVCEGPDGLCNAEQDKKRDNQGSFFWKEVSHASDKSQKQALQKKVNVTAPQKKVIVTAPQQALQAAKGLNNPCGETFDNINKCGNLTVMILGGDSQMKFGGAKLEAAESFPKPNSMVTPCMFSTSSDTCSAATLQNIPRDQWPYPMPFSGSSCDSVSLSLERKSLPALSFESPSTSTIVSVLNPVFSVNADLSGINALKNNGSSSGCKPEEFSGLNGCNPISLKKPHVLLSTKGKEVYLDKRLIENGDERKGDKLISDDGLEPFCTVKSELQCHGLKPSVSVEISKTLDENDSDVDSPCWKGTLAGWQSSPFGVSEAVSSQCLQNKLKTSNILNPLAPHFFPNNAEGSIDYYHENECGISDFSSFNKGESSAVYFGNAGSTNLGSNPSGLSYRVGTECSIDINESKREYALVNNSRSSSLLNSSHIFQPSLVEDYCTSNGRLVIGETAEGSLKGVKDVVHSGSERVPVLAKEHDLGPSSSEVGLVTDLNETNQSVSKSLSTTPFKTDVGTVINTVHNLSELLVQNCSNGLYSLNEHEHDIIQLIIDKLHVVTTNRVGQVAPMPKSTQTGTPYSPCKATEDCKSSSMQFRVAWTKTMSVPLEPENQNYQDGQKSYTAFTEKGLNFFSSCSDVGVEKSNDIIQVISKGLTDNHQIEEDTHPQALVYRNLWLEAEAALCSLKYRTCALSMKCNGMDGYESIKRRC